MSDEFAYLLHLGDGRKISEIKGFFDTLNVHNHLGREKSYSGGAYWIDLLAWTLEVSLSIFI